MKMVVDLPEALHARSPAPSSTPSATPSRRSSASSTCIPDRVASRRHLRALVVPQPRAHHLPLPAALHAAPVSVALPEGRDAALLGRQVAAGIGQARRALPRRRRLRAHRRRLRQHQRAHRLRRGRGLDHRRAARRRRASNCCARGQTVHPREPGARLRRAPPRQLGGGGRPRSPKRRATASSAASSPACSAWRWPASPRAALALDGEPQLHAATPRGLLSPGASRPPNCSEIRRRLPRRGHLAATTR